MPDDEAAKDVTVAARLWSVLGELAFTRSDAVVAVGGGTVTDLAGFVAATWLRGVAVVHVPTTLLAMVDAAVGGKTGINTAEGKNLVGAFHEPAGVLCDLDVLATLPRADFVAGPGRGHQGGVHRRPGDPRPGRGRPGGGRRGWDGPHTRELVERAIAVKADVVAQDLTESWLREILNYGHTLGHAVEQVEGYRRRHGEAVAIGMTYAAELALRAGRLSAPTSSPATGRCCRRWGCPRPTPTGRSTQLLAVMRRDKKSRGAPAALRRARGRRAAGAARGPRRGLAARRLHRHLHLTLRAGCSGGARRPSVLRRQTPRVDHREVHRPGWTTPGR